MFKSPLFACSIVALGLASVATSSASASVLYSYDDGQTDTGVGPPSSFNPSPQTGWGNYFVADPAASWIDSIAIAFGPTWPTCGPVTLWLFDDADDDFNPRNATPLTSVTFTPDVIGLSTFSTVPITPTQVSGGFFVLAVTNTVAGQDRMAAEDTSAAAAALATRSFLIYNPVAVGINVNNLGANAYIQNNVVALPLDGVWMIRASGSAVPEPTSIAMIGLGAVAMVRRRR